MGNSYKYAKYHTEFEDCPPEKYVRTNRDGYRFVFDDTDSDRSFSPVLILDEGRPARGGAGHRKECRGYGLSFFASEENARAMFASLRKNIPQIHKSIGNLLARVVITHKHGVASEPSKSSGHFTLHEFAGVEWEWEVLGKVT